MGEVYDRSTGSEVIDFAFLGIEPDGPDNRWLREA